MRKLIVLSSLLVVAPLVIAGCSIQEPEPPQPEEDLPAAEEETDCVVGSWTLDVADYEGQTGEYIGGLGIPIEGYHLAGLGDLRFTADGLVAVSIDLVTTGTIVTPEISVPLEEPSHYSASGDWVRDDIGVLTFNNWTLTTADDPDAGLPLEGDETGMDGLPELDFTQLAAVTAECDAETLLLQGDGAPVSSLWFR